MVIKTYLTKEEYKMSKGVDLDKEIKNLVNYDVDGSPAPMFIADIENYLIDYHKDIYDWDDVDLDDDFYKKAFKKAVAYQIEYVLQCGSLWNESGIKESGVIIPRAELEKLGISSMTHRVMHDGAMTNHRRY